MSSIAKKYGFADWRTIYDDPKNAEFRRKRSNPNVICPGDEIFIRDKEPREEALETKQMQTFRLKGRSTALRIVVEDGDGEPFSGRKYELKIADKSCAGITDAKGLIEQTIPADAEEGELALWLDDDAPDTAVGWTLKVGHLDPVEEVSGVQARLNNLGFDSGAVDGINGPRTKAAVKAFQEKYGLVVDGIPGPRTQAKLEEVYGC